MKKTNALGAAKGVSGNTVTGKRRKGPRAFQFRTVAGAVALGAALLAGCSHYGGIPATKSGSGESGKDGSGMKASAFEWILLVDLETAKMAVGIEKKIAALEAGGADVSEFREKLEGIKSEARRISMAENEASRTIFQEKAGLVEEGECMKRMAELEGEREKLRMKIDSIGREIDTIAMPR